MKTIDFYKPNNEEAIKALEDIENDILTLVDETIEIEDFDFDIDELIEDELREARELYEDKMDEDDFLEGNYPDRYFVELFEMRNKRNRILEYKFQQKTYEELRETPGLAFEF